MSKLLSLLLVLSLSLTSVTAQERSNETIRDYFIYKEDLTHWMNYLSSDELEGRQTGTNGIAKAAEFIETEFAKHGIAPLFETYKDSFEVNGLNAYNIVGIIEGSDPKLAKEAIIIGAHYDHIGIAEQGVGEDYIYNGASDNASGTATVLALAKSFAKFRNNKRTLIFALFSAEEMGLKGSIHLAQKLRENAQFDYYTMLNFEMVSRPMSNKEPNKVHLTGIETSTMTMHINEYLREEFIVEQPELREMRLFMRSDNYPFYRYLNIPAQTFTTFDRKSMEYYHQVNDDIELVDFDFMHSFTNRMVPIVLFVANTPKKIITLLKVEE
ncbi:MAG: M20/M25/M40 family metallo-hydrolase [Flavobacteriaceae bacterium]|nr:M20/M25/M40 family metallo-hydrolase [Flavobacteriaceae bacterium]